MSAEINHSHHKIVSNVKSVQNINHKVLTEGEMLLLVWETYKSIFDVDRFHISDSKELGRGLKGG